MHPGVLRHYARVYPAERLHAGVDRLGGNGGIAVRGGVRCREGVEVGFMVDGAL